MLFLFFDTFVLFFWILAIQKLFWPNEKNITMLIMFQIYASGGDSCGKTSSNDIRMTVITSNVVRHVPRASGPFS